MIVNVVFYQDPEPEDCNVLYVFEHKEDAKYQLEQSGWWFNTDYCIWNHKDSRGFIEILERELR